MDADFFALDLSRRARASVFLDKGSDFYFYYAIWVAIIVKLEPWFQRHAFLSAIVAVLAVVTWGTFALAWHFNIPCPHCGFNINLPKDLWQGSPMVVPPCCPNCGADLTVGHVGSFHPWRGSCFDKASSCNQGLGAILWLLNRRAREKSKAR